MKNLLLIIILHSSFLILNCFAQQPGWQIIPAATASEFNSIHYLDKFDLYICGEVLLNIKSTDGGLTWQVTSFPTTVTLNDIAVIDQNIVVTVGDGGTILRTTDGGNSWVAINSGVTDDLLSVSFVDSFGICGGRYQTILHTSNSGASWNIAQSGFWGGFLGASMLSPQIGFVAGENSIFQPLFGQTTDSGQNWDFTAFYLNNNEGRATGVDFTDMFVGYASARVWDGRGAIAKTTNSGSNWVTTFFTKPLWGIDFPISSASLIGYAAGDSGKIFKTYNAGDSWQQQQSGTTSKLNKVYFIDLDNGFAVGENGLILRTTTGGEPATNFENSNPAPFTFELSQNYPNPFNPSTVISWQSAVSSWQILKVFDVLGNEVVTLVDEHRPAGSYDVEFDGTGLPSGIYFYRLISGSYSSTKKMILMR